jgi:large subunit ribosomal protein L19e
MAKKWLAQKRMAAKLLKCGLSRVRMTDSKEVREALTREDIRQLIKKGLIWAVQKKGTSRAFARYRLRQKKLGRRKGTGSRKGTRMDSNWVAKVRSLRALISQFKKEGKIDTNDYRKVYLMIKGGLFRSKKHLIAWLKEKQMLREKKWQK